MSQHTTHCRRRLRRRASLTSEAVVILSALVIVTIAILVFGMVVTVQNAVTYAAIEGARAAGQGRSLAQVTSVVDHILLPYHISTATNAGLALEVPPAATQTQGVITCTPPVTPVVQTGYVRVTVSVSASAVPLANQLQNFQFSFSNLLTKSAVVALE